MLDPAQARQSVDTLITAAQALVRQHAQAARALANGYYQQVRQLHGFPDPFIPTGTALPDADKVAQYVDWAAQPLLSPPAEQQAAPEADPVQLVTSKAADALEKLVTDTGRQQIVDNVHADVHAKGWAREARPDACWFCAMLATRGAVYGSAKAAGLEESKDGLPENSYHTHCHCQVVPVFGAYEPPAHVRQWQNLYEKATGDKRGAAKAWAFQEAYEGRQITRRSKSWNGYGRKPGQGVGKQPKSRDEQMQIAEGMSDARAQQALDRARQLYGIEGDPVGDRQSWIRVLEGRLGKPQEALPGQGNLFASWDDAQLQKAVETAERLLAVNGEAKVGGSRGEWIEKLKAEQARRAVYAK